MQRIFKVLPAIAILLGCIMLVYMILVESEPGAVPLILFFGGLIWILIDRYRTKNS